MKSSLQNDEAPVGPPRIVQNMKTVQRVRNLVRRVTSYSLRS